MKILKLRFKNLNSLYGEWSIDFTNPEYISSGIFAITGPTGTGKTTILDAICLALYGKTPRLSTVSKSTNEIMSRQTAECFAEVLFETNNGRFLCHWSQYKARKKIDGALVDSTHEISEDPSGMVIESSKRAVASVIEEKTGMDFERFTRSILLAQGGFAAFLQASPDERSPILEQITGTDMYSRISILVHERNREEKTNLEKLEDRLKGITILQNEDEEKLRDDLTKKDTERIALSEKSSDLSKMLNWLTCIDDLKKEINDIQTIFDEVSIKIENSQDDRIKLHKALLAADIEAAYTELNTHRKQLKDDITSLKQLQHVLPELQKLLDSKKVLFLQAKENLGLKKSEQNSELKLISEVRALDAKITEKKEELTKLKKDYEDCNRRLSDNQDKYDKTSSLIQTGQIELSNVENYLDQHASDEGLIAQNGIIAGIVGQYSSKKVELRQKETEQDEVRKLFESEKEKYERQITKINELRKDIDKLKQSIEKKNRDINSLLRDRTTSSYRQEKDDLLRKKVFLLKVIKLDDERERLEDGTPCPLCGSLGHPYAEGNVPSIDETEKRFNELVEIIEQVEKSESVLKALEDKDRAYERDLYEKDRKLSICENDKNNAETSLSNIERDIKQITETLWSYKQDLLPKIKPYGFDGIDEEVPDSLLISLQERLDKWNQHIKKKIDIEKDINALKAELKKSEGVIETLKDSSELKERELKSSNENLGKLEVTRRDLFGSKDPNHEERRLEKELSKAEQTVENATDNYDKQGKILNETQTKISTLQEALERREPEVRNLESVFLRNCNENGFDSEATFLDNRLSSVERAELDKKFKALDNEMSEITSKKKDRESRLELELAKKITDKAKDDLIQEHAEIIKTHSDVTQDIGSIRQKLSDNDRAKNKHQEQMKEIEKQKNECIKWNKLHDLIGSANGKKFRNFAQGITFQLMVSHANKQLRDMTDRYLLQPDKDNSLELNVVDNYQAGEVRSTKNLSGGESFIVSLCLALGLSQMASKKVRVDSLFLDEGFGTLDEDALETALESLANLHQEGKIIGVISHVSALKERIPTQINVQPLSGGKSIIRGPGVTRLV